MTAKIVVVGSYTIEFIFQVERFPAPGETVGSDSLVRWHGGAGCNQAVAAARLGADVTLVACVGDDAFGTMAREFWQREGIDTRFVASTSERPTGTSSVYVDADGQNMISLASGANKALQASHVQAAAEAIAAADVVMTVLEIPVATAQTALNMARRHPTRGLLTPTPVDQASMELMTYADIIVPSESELEAIYGEVDLITGEGAEYMLTSDDQVLVVNLEFSGARWIKRDGTHGVAGFAVEPLDERGGRDCFSAALAVALAEGQPLEAAMTFANGAAALATTRTGSSKSMPHRQDVEDFVASHME